MRKDLYPFSITPRDAVTHARSTRTFPLASEEIASDHAAPPALANEAGVLPAKQPTGSTDPIVRVDAAQR